MFDKKTSCLVRGIVGVIFGLLALILPSETQATFYGLFWILIILGILIFIFLAITAKSDESLLWFGLAAALLIIGVASIIFAGFIALLFILIIAAVAIYNGFTDITLALTHPRTKYLFIPAMILTGIALLAVLYYYFPALLQKNLLRAVVGTFALAFGLFSIMLGFYKPEGSDEGTASQRTPSCSGRNR